MIPLPLQPKIVKKEKNKATFEIDALYPGYGATIGNSLRRVLLSSLEGAAITQMKIKGVPHEFSTIPGVMEDVVTIMLNLKQMRFRVLNNDPQKATLKIKGEKEVKASDFEFPSQVELISKDCHVATLTQKNAELEMEIQIEKGLGYVPTDKIKRGKLEIGVIPLDAIFTPIRRVNYEVENMRVGDRTDYNRLRFVIETDGSISPADALDQAVKITIKQLEAIADITIKSEKVSSEEAEKASEETEEVDNEKFEKKEEGVPETETLKTRIEDLKLSTRVSSALSAAGVRTIGGLTRKKENDLLEIEGVGKKAVDQIKQALAELGLTLK